MEDVEWFLIWIWKYLTFSLGTRGSPFQVWSSESFSTTVQEFFWFSAWLGVLNLYYSDFGWNSPNVSYRTSGSNFWTTILELKLESLWQKNCRGEREPLQVPKLLRSQTPRNGSKSKVGDARTACHESDNLDCFILIGSARYSMLISVRRIFISPTYVFF